MTLITEDMEINYTRTCVWCHGTGRNGTGYFSCRQCGHHFTALSQINVEGILPCGHAKETLYVSPPGACPHCTEGRETRSMPLDELIKIAVKRSLQGDIS